MKMRKCVIYFGFNNPLKFKRGVENVILFQAQSLGENIEKYYIFFDDENVEFNWNGINCIGIRKNKFRFISLNKLINKKFKNKKYIIHSHNYLMSFFLFRKTDIFTVNDGLYYQANELNHKLKNLFRIIEKKVYKKSKLIHFISKFSKEKSLYYGSNYKIIYITTPFEKVKKVDEKMNWKDDKLKIFTVRSIEERANIELLIELAKRNQNYDIKVAGKGPLLKKYREEIKQKRGRIKIERNEVTIMMEDTYYQLEEALVQGFQTPEEYQAYKELKEHYEEVTGDYSFSKRELTSQLEISLQNHRGVEFEEHEKEEYLDLVQKLEEFDSSLATHYCQLID